jgi:hypothetical protein
LTHVRQALFYTTPTLKKLILTVVFLYCVTLSIGQNLLQHYERKATFDHIYLPFEKFISSDYRIVYHDSIYNTASITIKKGTISGVKKIRLKITVNEYIYSSIELSTKSTKKFELLKTMLAASLSCTSDKFETSKPYLDKVKKIKVVIRKLGSRKLILISQIE